jgi:FkbM family methyltransferase
VSGRSSALRGLAGRVRRSLRPTELDRRIAALGIAPGDVAIDCGANIGDVTAALVRRGAFVHAFEPNPDAFAVLAERFGDASSVELRQQAVLDRAGRVRLYLHVDATHDPVGASVGSSVLPFKGNVDEERYVEVDAIDVSELVLGLPRPVKVVKIDVEGAECPIVNRLIDTGAIERTETVLVELHDRHIPELTRDYAALRERLEREGLVDRVLTDWE